MSISTLHINSAVGANGGNSNVNLSNRVLTTFKIGQILPVFHQALVPGDKFSVRSHMFCRTEPLAVPSYVNLKYRTFSCFVPYHQVKDGIDAFFQNQTYNRSVSVGLVRVMYSDFYAFFRSHGTTVATESSHDFQYNNGSYIYYGNYTAFGNFCRKTLDSLGYRLPDTFHIDNDANLNALPLLCYAHAYNSYMSYSVNYNTSALSNLLETVKRTSGTVNLSPDNLLTIFSSILLTFEDSFLTNAWSKAYLGQNESNFSTKNIPVIGSTGVDFNSSDNRGVETTRVGDEGLPGVVGSLPSALQIRMLLRFEDFFRRSNFCGSKDVEQIYSRFGVKVDDYKVRFPYYLGESTQSVQIGDVTSTSDTDNAPVGAYAGKAIGSDDSNFNYRSTDYGMLITFGWYAPDVMYYQGVDKEVLRLEPFDFYTPELDQGFAAMIPFKEVYDSVDNTNFGFCPLYSEYLYPKDVITGEFTRRAGFDAWHFGRSTDLLYGAQTDSLIYMSNVGTQFERIFNITDPDLVDADTIYTTISHNVSASRPMRDVSGKTLLGNGSLNMGVNGSQIE